MSSILLVGSDTFTTPLAALFERGGHQVRPMTTRRFLSDTLLIAPYEIAVEVENTAQERKRDVLMHFDANALVLTCALATSATIAASWVKQPALVVGFGVLPPLGETNTIELARALQTDDAHWLQARDFWTSMNQTVVEVADSAGLVRARVVCCLINEAFSALQERVASEQDIDRAMKLGTNYPHGPFEWGERLGLDTVLGVMTGLYDEWGEDRYRPSPLLRQHVVASSNV